MKKATVRSVDTPHGEGRLHTRRATSPIATLLLSFIAIWLVYGSVQS